jgi:hypothetical protein
VAMFLFFFFFFFFLIYMVSSQEFRLNNEKFYFQVDMQFCILKISHEMTVRKPSSNEFP